MIIARRSCNYAFRVLDITGDLESAKVSESDVTTAPKRSTIVYQLPAKGKRKAVKVE